jgi:hypothetical protein
MTPSTQNASSMNLNNRLSAANRPTPASRKSVGIAWKASAIRSSAPPVRIVGSRSRYQGGYRVNV